MTRNIRFQDWLKERIKDPEFRAAMEELEPAYQVARLRIERGLTQSDLAKAVGTRQSSISRLESGKSQPSVSFLRRVAGALGARLEIQLVPEEEKPASSEPDTVSRASREAAAVWHRLGDTVTLLDSSTTLHEADREELVSFTDQPSAADQSDQHSESEGVHVQDWPVPEQH